MKQHKWHKEIKAWADGAEIESRYIGKDTDLIQFKEWSNEEGCDCAWENKEWEFRIKPQRDRTGMIYYRNNNCKAESADSHDCICWSPQPKEPQCECGKYKEIIPNQTTIDAITEARKSREPKYLYVYLDDKANYIVEETSEGEIFSNGKWDYIGKIKLEVEE